jgi:hypothetical protein
VRKERVGKDASVDGNCHQCGSPHSLKNCSSCRSVRYCSVACQQKDWKAHKVDCKRLHREHQMLKSKKK